MPRRRSVDRRCRRRRDAPRPGAVTPGSTPTRLPAGCWRPADSRALV